MKRFIIIILIIILIITPLSGIAYKVGDQVTCTIDPTNLSVLAEFSESYAYLSDNQFETSSMADTNIDSAETTLLGYQNIKTPLIVKDYGEISPFRNEQGLSSYVQHLKIDGAYISELYSELQAGNLSPAQRKSLSNRYKEILQAFMNSTEISSIDLNKAKGQIAGDIVNRILNDGMDLELLGDQKIKVSTNTDPLIPGHPQDIIGLVDSLWHNNLEKAKKLSEELYNMNVYSSKDKQISYGSQIVSRPDLYGQNRAYDNNQLTITLGTVENYHDLRTGESFTKGEVEKINREFDQKWEDEVNKVRSGLKTDYITVGETINLFRSSSPDVDFTGYDQIIEFILNQENQNDFDRIVSDMDAKGIDVSNILDNALFTESTDTARNNRTEHGTYIYTDALTLLYEIATGGRSQYPTLNTANPVESYKEYTGIDLTERGTAFNTLVFEYTPENADILDRMAYELSNSIGSELRADEQLNVGGLADYTYVFSILEKYLPMLDQKYTEKVSRAKENYISATQSMIENPACDTDKTKIWLTTNSPYSNGLSIEYNANMPMTIDNIICLLMNEEMPHYEDTSIDVSSSDITLSTRKISNRAEVKAVIDKFYQDYIIGPGISSLSEKDLKDSGILDAPNPEMFSASENGSWLISSIFNINIDICSKNTLTGQSEIISIKNDDLPSFNAATYGYLSFDYGGTKHYVRADDMTKALNNAGKEHFSSVSLISTSYMAKAEDGSLVIVGELDMARYLADAVGSDLGNILANGTISIDELLNAMSDWAPDRKDWLDLLSIFGNDIQNIEDWWKNIIYPDVVSNIQSPKWTISDAEPSITHEFDINNFIEWLKTYLDREDLDWINSETVPVNYLIDYLPIYLNEFSGTMLFDCERIITKQISNATTRKSSKATREPGIIWSIDQSNGAHSSMTLNSTSVTVSLGPGTTVVTANEQIRYDYESVECYDYYEEWILQPMNIVIYTREIKGQLLGVDGQLQDQNAIIFNRSKGATEERTVYCQSFFVEEDDYGQELDGNILMGTSTTFYYSESGAWINGIKRTTYYQNGLYSEKVDESKSYRIE